MATIKKRGESYCIRVSNGFDQNGKEIRVTMTYRPKAKSPKAIEKEVAKAAALFEEEVRNGSYVSGDKMKFSDYVKVWWDSWAVSHLSTRTASDYKALIERHALPLWCNLPITKIKAQHVQDLIDDLNKGHAPTTVHKIIVAIDSVMRYAYKMEVIRENPVKRCELPRIAKDDDLHYFTPEQARQFLEAIGEEYTITYKRKSGKTWEQSFNMSTQMQVFFYLALYSGCRRGELLALTWNDILFDEGKITITKATERLRTGEQKIKCPKTAAGKRDLRLPRKCFELLRRWHIEQQQLSMSLGADWMGTRGKDFDKNFVFIQMINGLQMHTDTPYQCMKRFIERYNKTVPEEKRLPIIRLHDLRHTSATLLLSEGMDIEEVSRRLGHAKASTTLDIYGHALPEKDDEAAGILEQLLG